MAAPTDPGGVVHKSCHEDVRKSDESATISAVDSRVASPAPVAPSPVGRRLASPSWLDLRLVFGIVLVAGSVLLGAVVVSRAGDTRPVVTARRDLAAGTTLRAADLKVSQVRLDDGGSARYVHDLTAAVGRTLTRPVSGDELLPAAAVAHTPARTTLTLALAEGAAPELHTGQRIELWLSSPSCAFVVLLPEVTVQSAHAAGGGSFGGAGDGQRVVISVAPDLASRIVAAQSIENATIRAGVLSGTTAPGAGATSQPSSAPSGATGTPGLPVDLAACVSAGTSR